MNTIDIHRYRMLVNVSEFGVMHRDLFPAAGVAARLFAAVSRAVDQLSAGMTTQVSGQGAARDGATSKAAARQSLWQALNELARLRLGVAIQPRPGFIRKGTPRKLIRMKPFELRLQHSVLIRLQRHNVRPRQFRNPTHDVTPERRNTSSRRLTAFAWASSPSRLASSTATGPNPCNPAGVNSCTVMPLTKSSTDRPLYARAYP